MSLDGDIALLSRIAMFGELSAEQLRLLAFSAVHREIRVDEVLFREGDEAASGFLAEIDPPGLADPPFSLPKRYFEAAKLAKSGMRTFRTTSTGRLFDTAAALLGWSREVTFEGQAAIWLEHLARRGGASTELPVLSFADGEIDYRPTLAALIELREGVGNERGGGRVARAVRAGDRLRGRPQHRHWQQGRSVEGSDYCHGLPGGPGQCRPHGSFALAIRHGGAIGRMTDQPAEE